MSTAEVTTSLRAGAGRAGIDFPDSMWPLDGFVGVHDPLFARVLVLATDAPTPVVLAVLDQTSLPPEPLEEVRRILVSVTGADAADVVVSVSHTFSAPHLLPVDGVPATVRPAMQDARAAVFDAVERAASDAVARLRDATIGFGTGSTDVAVNRDIETTSGMWIGANPEGTRDESVPVVRLADLRGETIAVLAGCAVQSSVLSGSQTADGGCLVSADLAGAAVGFVEAALGPGAVALFLIGAAGDQSPRTTAVQTHVTSEGTIRVHDAGSAVYATLDEMGADLGREIARTAAAVRPSGESMVRLHAFEIEVDGQVPLARELIRPTRTHDFVADGGRSLPFWLLRLGPVTIVGVQPELSAATGLEIVRGAGAPCIVTTMFNGGAKYLPDAPAFDRLTYEAMSSRYARGSAELLTDAVLAQLRAVDHP